MHSIDDFKHLLIKQEPQLTHTRTTIDICNHDFVLSLLESPSIPPIFWNCAEALGDTYREKFESLYVKISQIFLDLVAKGGKGYPFLVIPPEVYTMFDAFAGGGIKICEQQSLGWDVTEIGVFHRKWRLFEDLMLKDQILIGDNYLNPSKTATLMIQFDE